MSALVVQSDAHQTGDQKVSYLVDLFGGWIMKYIFNRTAILFVLLSQEGQLSESGDRL